MQAEVKKIEKKLQTRKDNINGWILRLGALFVFIAALRWLDSIKVGYLIHVFASISGY